MKNKEKTLDLIGRGEIMKNQVGMINKNGTLAKKLNKINLPLLLMLLPGVICLVVMKYIPMAGIIVAFKNVSYNNTIWNAPWVGFENFKFLFATPDAWLITKHNRIFKMPSRLGISSV